MLLQLKPYLHKEIVSFLFYIVAGCLFLFVASSSAFILSAVFLIGLYLWHRDRFSINGALVFIFYLHCIGILSFLTSPRPLPYFYSLYSSFLISIVAFWKHKYFFRPGVIWMGFFALALLLPSFLMGIIDINNFDYTHDVIYQYAEKVFFILLLTFISSSSRYILYSKITKIIRPLVFAILFFSLYWIWKNHGLNFTGRSSWGLFNHMIMAPPILSLFCAFIILLWYQGIRKWVWYDIAIISGSFFVLFMTGTRGGFFALIIAVTVDLLFRVLMKTSDKIFVNKILPLALVGIVTCIIANSLLNGNLFFRLRNVFTHGDTSARKELALSDIEIFKANPVFGVPPLTEKNFRPKEWGWTANSHTEYTKLLVNHGLFGITFFALIVYLYFFVRKKYQFLRPHVHYSYLSFFLFALLSAHLFSFLALSFLMAFVSQEQEGGGQKAVGSRQ